MPPTPHSLRIAASLRRITSRPLPPLSSFSFRSSSFSLSFPRRQVSSSPALLRSKPAQDTTPKHQPPPRPSDPASAPAQAPPTDLSQLDVLGNTPIPATSVDICHSDGFSLNSGIHITGGSGAMLVGGEAFEWRPWRGSGNKQKQEQMSLINEKGQWEVEESSWGVLGLVWPRPDLLILGLGPEIRPISPATRQAISKLGIRVEILDTRNAASQYNLLATERGVENVAAALVPIGWKEGVGAV
ncbi:hypothetical protein QBC42DRAFT_260809 [Cladorrhinum samala]|uniref:NADH dehydrogenase [ubiquinone] 1 alpha subcomplex assembly factor 3 n=1 Tax=Cladorrhinum samala TaxID=585594 RepID=A0AAV9HY83_9PEZI|nr:hypothetical protein QBC42DRAFT_260809 [Cladorrhinum samala]